MAPAADVLYTAVTYTDDGGRERYGYAMVPRRTPGVVVHDDWDALGMRASGSNSVSFEDVRLPLSALRGGFPVGDAVEYMERNLARRALPRSRRARHRRERARERRRPDSRVATSVDPHAQMLAAESFVDLSACRAVFSRAAALIDEHHERNPTSTRHRRGADRAVRRGAERKAFIGEAAVRIVDRALALSGGAGYLNGSPLARAYRDVRATAFMHPLGANRAYAFLGQLAASSVIVVRIRCSAVAVVTQVYLSSAWKKRTSATSTWCVTSPWLART